MPRGLPAGYTGGRRSRATVVACVVVGLVAALAGGGARAQKRDRYESAGGTEAAIITGGALAYGLGWWFDRSHEALTPEDVAVLAPDDLNALDRTALGRWSPGASRASDWLVAACAAAPLGLVMDGGHAGQRGEIGLMYVETALLTTGVTYLVKNAVGRVRPYAYGDNPAVPDAIRFSRTTTRSFPSGHTANAFAAMVFFAAVSTRLHPDSGHQALVWGGCLTAAATTGYLRFRAGRHFPTDIVVGAAVGAAVGWGVPRAHEFAGEAPAGSPTPRGGKVAFGLGFGF